MTQQREQSDSDAIAWAAWPHFSEDEIDIAMQVLRSGKVNQWTGHYVKDFEKAFSAYVDAEYSVGVMNGTVALELALHAIGIQPGDEVIMPCRTFFATASAIAIKGAKPIMADVDLNTQNITAETIRPHITERTKAIVVVHLAGLACDMTAILSLARQHKLKVIEDCAQAHGARYKGKHVGTIGDIGAFSFCQDKILTAGGEGGMVVTNNKSYWQRMWSYKDHGKNYEAAMSGTFLPNFKWLHDEVGSNYRMTELQAAIGYLQLQKLDAWLLKRRQHAMQLRRYFSCYPDWFTLTHSSDDCQHAYYKFYVFLNIDNLPKHLSQAHFVKTYRESGIPCMGGICPEVYLEEAFANCDYMPSERLPNAKQLGESSLMFQVHPTLNEKHMQKICEVTDSIIASK